jgi:hypothetical protein
VLVLVSAVGTLPLLGVAARIVHRTATFRDGVQARCP